MKHDDNVYEVYHVIDITYENEDKEVVALSASFNTIKAESLEDARLIIKKATPHGKGTFVSECNVRQNKTIYIENINNYTIIHKLIIRKNGIALREDPDTKKSTEELIVEGSSKPKPSRRENRQRNDSKSNKSHSSRNDFNNRNKKHSKPHKDKNTKRGESNYKKSKRNRTEIKEVNLQKLDREMAE